MSPPEIYTYAHTLSRRDALPILKEIGPSTELRKGFGHEPARCDEFQRRYRAELTAHPAELDRLRALAGKQVVTLVYSAHDEAHNDAVVLHEVLTEGG